MPKVKADLPRRCEYIVNRKENGKASIPAAPSPRPGHAANAIVDTCPVSDSQTRFWKVFIWLQEIKITILCMGCSRVVDGG